MLIAIRHGNTQLDGKDSKYSGYRPVPLTSEGIKNAISVGEALKKINVVDTSKPIYSSPVKRAMQTAEEVASHVGAEVEPKDELKGWNIGKFVGQSEDKTRPEVNSYIENPNKTIPGGESYNQFKNRLSPFIKNLVESDDINTAVTHSVNINLIKAIAKNKGGEPDKKLLMKPNDLAPDGILLVNPDWSVEEIGKIHV